MSPDVEELSTTGRTTGRVTTGRRTKTDHIVLRLWLFQHRYNAYTTHIETLILAVKAELTTKQVHQRKKADSAGNHWTGGEAT